MDEWQNVETTQRTESSLATSTRTSRTRVWAVVATVGLIAFWAGLYFFLQSVQA